MAPIPILGSGLQERVPDHRAGEGEGKDVDVHEGAAEAGDADVLAREGSRQDLRFAGPS
jgi:hypothetical protein